MLILEIEMFHSTSQVVVRKTVHRFLRMQREIKLYITRLGSSIFCRPMCRCLKETDPATRSSSQNWRLTCWACSSVRVSLVILCFLVILGVVVLHISWPEWTSFSAVLFFTCSGDYTWNIFGGKSTFVIIKKTRAQKFTAREFYV